MLCFKMKHWKSWKTRNWLTRWLRGQVSIKRDVFASTTLVINEKCFCFPQFSLFFSLSYKKETVSVVGKIFVIFQWCWMLSLQMFTNTAAACQQQLGFSYFPPSLFLAKAKSSSRVWFISVMCDVVCGVVRCGAVWCVISKCVKICCWGRWWRLDRQEDPPSDQSSLVRGGR